jgi:archaellum component FlaC
MEKLATKTLIKKNYRNAFICNLVIIINTENTSSKLVMDSMSTISNIINTIKMEIPNPKSYFEVFSNNIEYLKKDIPNTHKIIIQEISNILDNNIKFYS